MGRGMIARGIILIVTVLVLSLITKVFFEAGTKYKVRWWGVMAIALAWGWLTVATRFSVFIPLLRYLGI